MQSRRRLFTITGLFCLLLLGVIFVIDFRRTAIDSSATDDHVEKSSRVESAVLENTNPATPNPFTDHDSNLKELNETEEKLLADTQQLSDQEFVDLVADLIRDEREIKSSSEVEFQQLSDGSIHGLEPQDVDDLKFGDVTAEHFAAVSVDGAAYLFEGSLSSNSKKDILARATENDELISDDVVDLDEYKAHPAAVVACPCNLDGLTNDLKRARSLLATSLERADVSPIQSFLLLGDSEMLAEEVDVRSTCFKGWQQRQR